MYKYCNCLHHTNKYYHPTISKDGETCGLCGHYLYSNKEKIIPPDAVIKKLKKFMDYTETRWSKEMYQTKSGMWKWKFVDLDGKVMKRSTRVYKSRGSARGSCNKYIRDNGLEQQVYTGTRRCKKKYDKKKVIPELFKCKICSETKVLVSGYYKHSNYATGYRPECKVCIEDKRRKRKAERKAGMESYK